MNPIKDSIHDYITLGPVASELIDTPAMQRLRHVKQLSTVRLVYPSANHTRFEHSLGVYHLARTALSHLDVDEETAALVRAAALVHDVGHGPYGHQTEELIERRTGKDHDDIAWLLTDPERELCQTLESHDLDPVRVAALVAGEDGIGELVSGELDVDRMDYLIRDAHHTGVPYGTIDHGRLVRALRLEGGRLVLGEGNVATAESLLVARSLMNGVVYRHHVSRIAGAMLERACERYLDRTETGIEQFRRMPDHELLVELSAEVPELGRRIERRQLYKRAVWAEPGDVPRGTMDAGHEEERTAEREIADHAGVDPTEVIVDIPDRPGLKESGTNVVVDGVVQQLEDASELVSGLRATERARWRLGVYCPEEHASAVGEAATAVLGLKPGTGNR
ncbi:HD domain-containing protein [Halovenus sp. WSH3]|uniref:HD domain-containing protein n=1 Tax=Halovenus carboxidivorans TaxID=2692199 RepID=A0A6B0T9G9_9EURY|nr:HD domain-containing protein [Halovenus carboxidivorans]MXR52002.1 HD domain-containing protein [Halovenus carboxidivorans]